MAERKDVHIKKRRGHLMGGNALGQSFDDRGFANAGFADDHRRRNARSHLL
jgi:hypothetical protein